MQNFKVRAYPFLIGAAGVLAAVGGYFTGR